MTYYSLHSQLVILVYVLLLMVRGTYTAFNTGMSVFPDLSAPTVMIVTKASGMAPGEVERLMIFPVGATVNGAMDVRHMRSSSTIRFPMAWVELDWGTDIYRVRQIVSERLTVLGENLPEGVGRSALGLQSSISGEMMILSLTADSTFSLDLRTIVGWTIRSHLLSTSGVAQVAVIGGDIREYQVLLDLVHMKHYDVGLNEVLDVCRNMNRNANGSILYEFLNGCIIRGVLSTSKVEEIA